MVPNGEAKFRRGRLPPGYVAMQMQTLFLLTIFLQLTDTQISINEEILQPLCRPFILRALC
jgi:hypothetical protein